MDWGSVLSIGTSCSERSSEKSCDCPSWFSGPPVAVGMNIDIASIDMVSEVNMVSMEVHVSVNLPLGRRRGKKFT